MSDYTRGLEDAAKLCEQFAIQRTNDARHFQDSDPLKADMLSESHAANECARRIRTHTDSGKTS